MWGLSGLWVQGDRRRKPLDHAAEDNSDCEDPTYRRTRRPYERPRAVSPLRLLLARLQHLERFFEHLKRSEMLVIGRNKSLPSRQLLFERGME